MSTRNTKMLKVGVFIAGILIYYYTSDNDFSFTEIVGAFFIASAFYLLVSAYCFILSVSGNHLITMILAPFILIVPDLAIEKVCEGLAWHISEDMMYICYILLSVILLAGDIRYLIKTRV